MNGSSVLNQLAKGSKMIDLILVAKVLTPTVQIDTPQIYKAIYKDTQGSYNFEIKRDGTDWRVTSDGFECCKTDNREYLIWNFESQLGNYSPKVLN
jgi:hypothetical protein